MNLYDLTLALLIADVRHSGLVPKGLTVVNGDVSITEMQARFEGRASLAIAQAHAALAVLNPVCQEKSDTEHL